MARVEITARVLSDLERLFGFTTERNPRKAREQLLSVRRALELLADHPLLGRDADDGRRELFLLRGRDGYIAKYRWLPAEEVVLLLAVRHHREAGYSEEQSRVLRPIEQATKVSNRPRSEEHTPELQSQS